MQYPAEKVAISVTINSWFPFGTVAVTLNVSEAVYVEVPDVNAVVPRLIVNVKPVDVVVVGIFPCCPGPVPGKVDPGMTGEVQSFFPPTLQ